MSDKATTALRARKLQPKLRLIANGDSTVNTLRAEQCGCLAVRSPKLLKIPQRRGDGAEPGKREDLPKRDARAGHLRAVPDDVNANVFVYLRNAATKPVAGE